MTDVFNFHAPLKTQCNTARCGVTQRVRAK